MGVFVGIAACFGLQRAAEKVSRASKLVGGKQDSAPQPGPFRHLDKLLRDLTANLVRKRGEGVRTGGARETKWRAPRQSLKN
ncbi:hypothetical protein BDZ91DRAFT_715383, partial [Kalaharituber pfeilii]